MKANVSSILVCLVLSSAGMAHAATIDDARRNGLGWLVAHQDGDGAARSLKGLEVQTTAAFVEALAAGGLSKSPQQAQALAWLQNASAGSLDAQAAQVVALSGNGRAVSALAARIRDARTTSAFQSGQLYGGAFWGPYAGYAPSTMDTAHGMGALRAAGLSYPGDGNDLALTVLCSVLAAQLTTNPWSGAWPFALPQSSQPTQLGRGSLLATTAMTYELKRLRQSGKVSAGVSACSRSFGTSVDAALSNAKTWLIAQRNSDNGFAERNPQTGTLEASHPLLTALAIRTLALFAAEGDGAATTAVADGRTWLANQQNADGSWLGDSFVTARAVAALPAASGSALTDTDADGLTDVVEQRLGTNSAVADAQGVLPIDATAQSGVTATAFVANGVLNQVFSHALSAQGGTGPYTFTLKRGALPQGLNLAPGGAITGTPVQSGRFAFDYLVTDAQGQASEVIGRIDIADPAAPDAGDVPIPLWALGGLAVAMIAVLRRVRQ